MPAGDSPQFFGVLRFRRTGASKQTICGDRGQEPSAVGALRSQGALACLQLNHAGRFAKTPKPLLPSPIIADNLAFNMESLKEFMEFFPFEKRFGLTRYLLSQIKTWGRAMTDEDRNRVIRDFGDAASRAWQAGFDMVELHGANGYLLCQYLSKFTNRLPTGFGGNLTSRATFPLAVIKEIKKRVPKGFAIGFRLMLKEWVPDGIDPGQALTLARCLEKEGIDYLSVSVATYNSLFSPGVRKKMAKPAYLEKETAALTKAMDIPTIISGRITTAFRAEKILQKGAASLIGLGRPLRADPLWLAKAKNPNHKIIPCINCNDCLKQVVLEKGFNCRQWPDWIQMQTRLEHKFLTRNQRSLWIITGPGEMEIFKPYLPALFPKNSQGQGPRFLYLNDIAPPSCWEDTVLNEIRTKDYGQVFMAAKEDQPWRERLFYKLKGKMTALLNTPPRPQKVMVPIDLSETTLLVLRVLGLTLMKQPLFSFDFIHVETGVRPDHSWEEAKRIAKINDPIPLERIRTQKDVVSTLIPIVEKRGYGTVVMGKRGLGIKRWLLGSVSSGLLRQLKGQSLFLID